MGPQEDYIEMVLTCEGDFYDPNFHVHLEDFSNRLQDLITGGQRKLVLKKVEPWNSVRVTFNIPKDAAVRLKQLAEQGSQTLRELGVLAVQIEGDRVISLTIANKDNETTHLVFRTPESEPAAGSSTANSTYNLPNAHDLPPVSTSCVHNSVTHDEIEQYLKQQGVANTGFFDSIFNQPGAGPGFSSPNVVAPPNETLPFGQNRNIMQNKRQPANRHNSMPAVQEPYMFAPANRSVGHGLMQTNVNTPAFVAARNSTTYMPPPPSEVTATVVTPGQTQANFPPSLTQNQPLSHMSPKYPTPPPSVSTPGSPMPPSVAHFPHHHNAHQLTGNPNMVNVPRMMVMPQMNKGITSSSPLLVNLLQSDAAGHFNHLSLSQLQQQQQQQQQLKVRPPFESASPTKRKSRKTKKQRDNLSKGSRAEQGIVADQDVTNQLTSIYSALAQNRVPSVHQDFDGHGSSHFASAVPKQTESTVAASAASQSCVTSTDRVMATISQQAAGQNSASSAAESVTAAVTQQASRSETVTTATTTTEQIVNPYTGQLEPVDTNITNPDSCDDNEAVKQSGTTADVTSHAVPLECLHPPPNPLVALHSGMLHERMQKESEVQPPLSVVNRTANLSVTSAAQSAEGQLPAASRNTTVMNTPVTSMCSAKWIDSHAQPTTSFGIGPALQLRGQQVVFPPGMSTEARIEHLLRSANMSRAALADTAPPPYSVAAGKAPGFTTSAAVTSLEQAFGNNSTTMFPSGPTQTFSHSMQQQHIRGISMASSAVGLSLSYSTAYATGTQKMQAVNMSMPQGVHTMCLPAVVNPAVDKSHSLPQTAGEFLPSLVHRTSSVENSTLQSTGGKMPVSFTQAALNSMANAVETCATLVTMNQTTMSPCVNNAVISNMDPVATEHYAVTSAGPAMPMSTGTGSWVTHGSLVSAVPPTCGYDLMNGTIPTTSITAAGVDVPPMISVESLGTMPVIARTESRLSSAGTTIKTETGASSLLTQHSDSGNSVTVTSAPGSVSVTSTQSEAIDLSFVDNVSSSSLSPQSTHVAVAIASANMSPMSTVTASGLRLPGPASGSHPELTTTVTSVLSSQVADSVQLHQNINATTVRGTSLEQKSLHKQVSSSQANSTVHSATPHTSVGTQRHAEVVKLLEGNMQIEYGDMGDTQSRTQSGELHGSSTSTSVHSSTDATHQLPACVSVYAGNSQLLQQPSSVSVPHLNHDSDLSSQSACDVDCSTPTMPGAVENHRQSPSTADSDGEATLKHPTDREANKVTNVVETGDNVITVGFAISKEQSVVDLSSAVLSKKLPLYASDVDIVPGLSKASLPLKMQHEQSDLLPKSCIMEKLLLKNPDVRTTAPSRSADQPTLTAYSSVKPCVSCVQSGSPESHCANVSGGCTLEGHHSSAVNGDAPAVSTEATCAPGLKRAYKNRTDGTCIGASSTAGVDWSDRTVACSPAVSHCETKDVPLSSNVPSQDAGLLQQQVSHSVYSESPQQPEVSCSEDIATAHLHQRPSGEPLEQPTMAASTPPTDVTSASVSQDMCIARTVDIAQHALQQNLLTSAHIPLPAGESPAVSLAGRLPVTIPEAQEGASINDVSTSLATSMAISMVSFANISTYVGPWMVSLSGETVNTTACMANDSRYSDAGQLHSSVACTASTGAAASTSGVCTAHSGLVNRLASSGQAHTVTSSLHDIGTLPMIASRCSYTAVTPSEMSHPGLIPSSPVVCCSSPLSFLQQSTPAVGTTLVSAISEAKQYHHRELPSPSNLVSSSADAALVMSKHLTCHIDSPLASGQRGFNANMSYDVNTTVVTDQAAASVPVQNALEAGSVSEECASSGCITEESSKSNTVDQLLQKCIDESFSVENDVTAYMSEKVNAKLADKLKQRNKRNQAVFNLQRSDAVVYNVENLKQVNAVSPTVNNLQMSSSTSTSLSTVFPRSSPYYSSNFFNKSLHTPSRVNSVQHPITAPSFPSILTQSVVKVVKAIPCTDTTPPPSPKPAKVTTVSSTRSRPMPLSHSSSQPMMTMEKVQLNRPGVHMETLGEIKSVVIENRPLNHDRVIVKVEKLSEAKMKEMKAAAAAKVEETTASAVAAQPECLVTEHSYSAKTDESSPLKDSDVKPCPPTVSNEVGSTETATPQEATVGAALPTKLDFKKQNMPVIVTTVKAEKLANTDSSHMNCNDITSNGMIDELEDATKNLHGIENAERPVNDLSPTAKIGRGVKRKASDELSPVIHDDTQSSGEQTVSKTGLDIPHHQQPDDNHVVDAVMMRRQSHESTESHSSNHEGGTRWKKSMSESSETSSTADSISSEVRCLRRRSGDQCESPMSHVTRISTRSSTRKKQPAVEANDIAEVPISTECSVSPKSLPKNARGTKRKCVTAATELNDTDKKTPEVKNKVASPTSDTEISGRPKTMPHVNKNATIHDDKVVAPSSVKGRKQHADSVMIDINDIPTSAGGQDSAAIPSEVAKKTRAARPGATKNIEAELVVICDAKDVDKATKQVNARMKGPKADLKELPHGDQPAFKRATRSSKAKVDHCELPPPPSKRRRPVKEHR